MEILLKSWLDIAKNCQMTRLKSHRDCRDYKKLLWNIDVITIELCGKNHICGCKKIEKNKFNFAWKFYEQNLANIVGLKNMLLWRITPKTALTPLIPRAQGWERGRIWSEWLKISIFNQSISQVPPLPKLGEGEWSRPDRPRGAKGITSLHVQTCHGDGGTWHWDTRLKWFHV